MTLAPTRVKVDFSTVVMTFCIVPKISKTNSIGNERQDKSIY